MIEAFLKAVQPDFVQYDCKGVPGYLGYASKIAPYSPGIVRDSLEIWRRVTARHGIGLYIHFAGLWDPVAIQQHPEWARVRPDGTPDPDQNSTFGPYVDLRLIPTLQEAAEKYDLDGAWVDGECWHVKPDYGPSAARAFHEATGIDKLPLAAGDPGWQEFLELNREQFRRYVRRYVEALHRTRPGFEICSNWLYTTMSPEKPELEVDFLSGDYLGNAALSTARLDARYLAATDRTWDLLAWGFQSARYNRSGPVHKPAVQMMQEAAVTLAQGGAFQIYYQPSRAGRIDERHIRVMARISAFCRARRPWCFRSQTVPQVGLLFSGHSLYRTGGRPFGAWGALHNPARGLLDALLENHYSVDVIPDWKLEAAAPRYPLIVVPDWPDIGEEAEAALLRYARQGGSLLLAGAENAARFAPELSIRPLGPPSDTDAYIPAGELFASLRGLWLKVRPEGVAQTVEQRYPIFDSGRDAECAATLTPLGKGKVLAFYGPLGSAFAAAHSPSVRHLVRRLAGRIFEPAVTIDAPPVVEVALRRGKGRLLLSLANCAAKQVGAEHLAVDWIPPLTSLRIAVRTERPPRGVTVEPEGRPLRGAWRNGVWRGVLPRLEIHSILAFDL